MLSAPPSLRSTTGLHAHMCNRKRKEVGEGLDVQYRKGTGAGRRTPGRYQEEKEEDTREVFFPSSSSSSSSLLL